MNRKTAQKKGAFALILFCVLMLFLPEMAARGQEALLLSRVQARPALADTLDERAREIPLVYALYRRRFSAGAYDPAAVTGDEADAQRALLQEKTDELEQAGVLAASFARAVRAELAVAPMEAGAGGAAGFSGARVTVSLAKKNRYATVQCWWHTATGFIVGFSADIGAENADAAAMLCAYRDYLCLDGLDDWQDIAQDAAYSACLSPAGQLYIYCDTRANRLTLGAVSVTPEDAETILQQ